MPSKSVTIQGGGSSGGGGGGGALSGNNNNLDLEVQQQQFQQDLALVLRKVKVLAVLDHLNIVQYFYGAWLEIDQRARKTGATDNNNNNNRQ